MTTRADSQSTPTPAFCTVQEWRKISGMRRTATFEGIAAGHLPAKKLGRRTLINVQQGLAWMNALPAVAVRKTA